MKNFTINKTIRLATYILLLGCLTIFLAACAPRVLAPSEEISIEQAAEIAFTDLFKQYGNVMENKSLSETRWTAVKETFNERTVWIVDVTIFRSDWDVNIKEWGARVWVDVFTGDILQKAYQS